MTILDSGHLYQLDYLDGVPDIDSILRFVKREGEGYPGNVGHYPGTNVQEVCRVLIHRLQYLNHQIPCVENDHAIRFLREVILCLEDRAAQRHGRPAPRPDGDIETQPVCPRCGHIGHRCEEEQQ